MKSVAFFTNKGGVGKTTLTCNLAAFLASQKKKKILIVDADPQTNATQYMFEDNVLEEIYDKKTAFTIYTMARPLSQGKGYSKSHEYRRSTNFGVDVLLGDPRLALIEDVLAADWNTSGVRGIRTTYMFRKFLLECGNYDYVFFDMGPSLGSINRAVLIGCDHFIIPLSTDIFSIRATENISTWIKEWKSRLALQLSSLDAPEETEVSDLEFRLQLLGYVNQQYTAKKDSSGERRAVKAYEKILAEVPAAVENGFTSSINNGKKNLNLKLGAIPNLHSLVPMSQNSRKPIFDLKSSDGIVGAHFTKVREAFDLYESIAENFIANIEQLP
ncbi:ParA family protein [Pseudomonas seleniipraecipitans]|uniref:ParA family protein n=1 Tax=Phytopseudomonas seleniipraecipitans TaxID=640205 RepID=A0ABY5J4R7_9GAMM|nr:ParA family protein [Pseudomonas seleniipraecipitans]UUD63064.1 ParA family protein [Pseudomonas seleniipraecipitans]